MAVSGSGKANALLNLINIEPDIDNIYLYANKIVYINTIENAGFVIDDSLASDNPSHFRNNLLEIK